MCNVKPSRPNAPPGTLHLIMASIIGTDKGENLVDKSDQNCIDAKGGNDKLAGLAGNDKLNGGEGKDL